MSDQTTETIFDNTPEQTPVAETPAPEVKSEATPEVTSDYADLLATIKREDGTQKYANIPDVITALKASQEFIEQLKAEKQALEADNTQRKTAEEVLDTIQAAKPNEETPSDGIDLGQIAELVRNEVTNTLTTNEVAKLEKANADSVVEAFRSKFGDKAEEEYIKLAKENNLSDVQINDLSSTAPQAVLKLAGLDGKSSMMAQPIHGSINTEALQPAVHKSSAKLPHGATGKDYEAAWRAAGENLN